MLLSSHLLREVEAIADQLDGDRQRADRRPGPQAPSCSPPPAWSCARLDPAALHEALADAGLVATPGSDGALLVEAEAEAVGRAAAAAGLVLLELRPADTGGLEELYLSLTSSGREERAAGRPTRP